MKIEEKRLEDIRPYNNNPRLNDKAVPAVAESLKKFGWQQPIVIDRNGVIVCGHTRYKAALELGMKTAPCKYADELTEDEITAYRLADNKTAELAEWDADKMADELAKCSEFDMSAFGFDEEEPEDPEDIIEDNYDEDAADITPRTKRGDKYQLGDHTLVCGDATKKSDVDRLTGGQRVQLLLTDPPYNVDLGSQRRPDGKPNTAHIQNDAMTEPEFVDFMTTAAGNMSEHMEDGAAFYIFYAGLNHAQFERAIKNTEDFHIHEQLIWVKSSFVLGRNSDYQWMHECVLYGWKQGAPHYFTDDRTGATVIEDTGVKLSTMKKNDLVLLCEKLMGRDKSTTVLRGEKPTLAMLHPTVKPQELLTLMLRNSSKPGWAVMDPFGGSGSTMIACEQLGRKCYMMEIDPHYCDVIIDRWEKFTGNKARLIND